MTGMTGVTGVTGLSVGGIKRVFEGVQVSVRPGFGGAARRGAGVHSRQNEGTL